MLIPGGNDVSFCFSTIWGTCSPLLTDILQSRLNFNKLIFYKRSQERGCTCTLAIIPQLMDQLIANHALLNKIINLLMQKQDSLVEPNYKQYPYRIAILAIFCILSFINGMCWVVVSPISVPIARAYAKSDAIVSIIPMCFMFVYLIINFPSNWVLDVKGIKMGIMFGAVFTSLGAAIRCLVATDFAFVIVGQILCAIGQPFILNAQTKIAIRWFSASSRGVALAILSVSNIVGNAVGFIMPTMIVDDQESDIKIRSQFQVLLLLQFFITLISLLSVVFWFRERPPTPASSGSDVQSTQYLQGFKTLFRDRRFLGLMFSFGTINGSFNFLGSLLDNVLDCYGFSSDQVSSLATTMMIAGIISAAIFGFYIEKTLKYFVVFRMLGVLGIVQCVGFPLVLAIQKYNLPLVMILSILQGIVYISFMPLTFDYTCDILFPAGEAQITGCLMTMGNLFGVIFILIAQQILGLGDRSNSAQQNQVASLWSVIAMNVVTLAGVCLYFFYNSQLKRSNLDRKNNKGNLLGK